MSAPHAPGRDAVDDVARVRLGLASGSLVLRHARAADVPGIVALLQDDPLGAEREGSEQPSGEAWPCEPRELPEADLQPYYRALEAITADSRHLLMVGENDGVLVATMQVSFIPGMAHRGAVRCQLEAVRVARSCRSQGFGTAMIGWAIEEARRRNCHLVQLTTDKRRPEALAFYLAQGFARSHEGLKLIL